MRFFGRKYSAFIIILLNILYLSGLHVFRMLNRVSYKIEIDTIYMMSICKFSSLAFAYEDGGKKDKDIKSTYWRKK